MKYRLTLLNDGHWVGGFMARRDNLHEMLEELRDRATDWKQPIVATRVDRVKHRDTHIIEPR